jgi:hypothetical protein
MITHYFQSNEDFLRHRPGDRRGESLRENAKQEDKGRQKGDRRVRDEVMSDQ